MAELEGAVAIVTGGFSGIGRAAAHLMAERGAEVHVIGIRPERDAELELVGVEHHEVDVTDAQATTGVVDAVAARSGLDVLVTAAGIQRYGTVTDTRPDDWNALLDVNLTGTFHAVRAALPHLRLSGRGSIVIVSSVQAFVTQAAVAAYATSKGALNALARSIAVDEAGFSVRCNTVCPASVETPMLRLAARTFSDGSGQAVDDLIRSWGRMHPLGRVAQPFEVAEAIAFLAGERSAFITGIALPVDGGLLAKAAVVLPD